MRNTYTPPKIGLIDVLADRTLEGTARIVYQGGTFLLLSADGEPVAECKRPASLSEYGFNKGAKEVRHDYDLALAEG